jgi:integrase
VSVYKPKGSPYYQYDFEFKGHRFHGSTKRTNEREAKKVEGDYRALAVQDAREQKFAAQQPKKDDGETPPPLTMDDAIGRYWSEVGKHHAGSDNTWRDLSRLIGYFGATALLTDIDDDALAKLIAWRRGHRVVRGNKRKATDCPLISPATVNRSTTEVVKKLFTRAKLWGVKFDHEPQWRKHMLSEPNERVRELVDDEGDRLEAATRIDYEPFFNFAKSSGLRLRECLLKWPEVNWSASRIYKKGKGDNEISIPINAEIRSILWPLQGDHPEFVFTYMAARTRSGRVKGQKYPITYSGAKIVWRRLRTKAGVVGFRFHDFRHDLATKLLRETGNLKLVSRALNHSDLKVTAKYAHVLDSEVSDALQGVAESRRESRIARREAG